MYTHLHIQSNRWGDVLKDTAQCCLETLLMPDEWDHRELEDTTITLSGDPSFGKHMEWYIYLLDLGEYIPELRKVISMNDDNCLQAVFDSDTYSVAAIAFLWSIVRYGWESYILRDNILELYNRGVRPDYALFLGHWYFKSEDGTFQIGNLDQEELMESDAWNTGHALLSRTGPVRGYENFLRDPMPINQIIWNWNVSLNDDGRSPISDRQDSTGGFVQDTFCPNQIKYFYDEFLDYPQVRERVLDIRWWKK